MVFKDRLKGLREDRDLTQEQLAEFLKITRSALGNYETGLREPDISTLVKISNFFNVSLDYLLCRTNTKIPFSILYKKSK
ncbi:XRE family transcriptional regulator [Clostridium tetani]|nr:helix-turn-helix transcriptional regulator [Clostridium tetani]RXM79264.1 XRE family transcriptional regulator [Clostridium tetani]RYV00076.1 XRE family transcriptional regulator [Clostridium tetani]